MLDKTKNQDAVYSAAEIDALIKRVRARRQELYGNGCIVFDFTKPDRASLVIDSTSREHDSGTYLHHNDPDAEGAGL